MENTNKNKEKKGWHYFKDTAIIGLLVTVAISTFQIFQATRQTKQLSTSLKYMDNVQKALTTHFLGVFPGYIPEINNLLQSFKDENDNSSNDTIIIFEDVLYYGIVSSPEEFIKMNKLLLELADQGYHIVIAYYNSGEYSPIFKMIVQDELISPENSSRMFEELLQLRRGAVPTRDTLNSLREKYYDLSRKKSHKTIKKYEEKVSAFRKKLYTEKMPTKTPLDKEIVSMCMELDSIKYYYMGDDKKDIMSITFNDFVNMYRGFNNQIKQHFTRNERPNFIELIEMNEYMTMSCWLVKNKAILAFPSKYASDEIGFESQDNAFVNYIQTMLAGVRSNNRVNKTQHK